MLNATAIRPRRYILKGRDMSHSAKHELQIEECHRCGGSGTYPSSCYEGVCLACCTTQVGRDGRSYYVGIGWVGRYVPTAEWQAVLDERRVRREAKKVAQRDASTVHAPWVMGVALLAGLTGNPIAASVVRRAAVKRQLPTARQADAVFAAALRLAAPAPVAVEPTPVVEGKGVTIAGSVVSVKVRQGMYGTEYKMLVEDDRGFRVWGSVPRAIDPDAGDRVSFVANVERSKDDPGFGFYKRPRKVVAL